MEKLYRYINVRGRLISLDEPKVMGVINVTQDSFYSGSRYTSDDSVLAAASAMLHDGADFIDIGGYSSRPGAVAISAGEERERVIRAIKLIVREFPQAIISVDTFRSEIAREAVSDCGAHIINDISGGEADPGMFPLLAQLKVPYILMHMQGTPATMQTNPVYDDVVADILQWFGKKIVQLNSMGVADIIIDPGFGFGKTAEHNFDMLRRLGDFRAAGLPILAGISRKSMVWRTLEQTPGEALNGTTVLNTIALMNGADILRVHDVKEAKEAVKLLTMVRKVDIQSDKI
jgi:dihydropteroate synthase